MTDMEKLRDNRAADRLVVKIGYSKGHRGRVNNVAWEWPKLIERLGSPAKDNLTVKEFSKLSKTEQVRRKNQGYITTTHFTENKRKVENLSKRHAILAFDLDQGDLELVDELFHPIGGPLFEYEYYAHTTRSHTPASPRVRVIIPLLKEINPDEFRATSRILAQRLDATMKAIDPVSYRPAQISYLPSVCRDQEFLCRRNNGRLLDAHVDILETFTGDWKNHRELPHGERDRARESVDKAEHPLQKRGIVGAYCRARDVFAQMELMGDLYEPAEEGPTPTRWSFLSGTSRNGVMLYPEDGRIHSHHSTDPVADKNVCTFDLQRIHRYGHLDQGLDEYDDMRPQDMPSYRALAEAIQSEDEYADVQAEYARMAYDQEAHADDAAFMAELEDDKPAVGVVPAAAVATPNTDILALLDITQTGQVRKTLHNLALILQHDPRFKGVFCYNEMTERVVVTRPVTSKELKIFTPHRIMSRHGGDPITDDVRTSVRRILSAPNRGKAPNSNRPAVGWGLSFGDEDLAKIIDEVARVGRFHPIERYLKQLRWDGVPRVATMLTTYWHVKPEPYHAEVAEKFMLAAVARVFEPGHKFDYMVVFEGGQGHKKSTALLILAVDPEWFVEFRADIEKTDRVVENLVGKWIVEWPELSSLTRAQSESVKALLSSRQLVSRLAYRREAQEFKFRGVFVGTTNEKEYLRDQTGNRRFWPVSLPDDKPIDLDGLRRDVHQLWAETYEIYKWMRRVHPVAKHHDLPLALPDDVARTATLLQAKREIKGSEELWEGRIVEWLDTPVPESRIKGGPLEDDDFDTKGPKLLRERTCVWDVAEDCLDFSSRRRPNKVDRNTIARVLDQLPNWRRSASPMRFGRRGTQVAWVRMPIL